MYVTLIRYVLAKDMVAPAAFVVVIGIVAPVVSSCGWPYVVLLGIAMKSTTCMYSYTKQFYTLDFILFFVYTEKISVVLFT